MSDTPRTDALCFDDGQAIFPQKVAELARQLERELQRLRAGDDALRELQNQLVLTRAERDALASQLLDVQQECIALRRANENA